MGHILGENLYPYLYFACTHIMHSGIFVEDTYSRSAADEQQKEDEEKPHHYVTNETEDDFLCHISWHHKIQTLWDFNAGHGWTSEAAPLLLSCN